MPAPTPSTSASPTPMPALPAARAMRRAPVTSPEHGRRVGHLGVSTNTFLARPASVAEAPRYALPAPAGTTPGAAYEAATAATPSEFPDVWLVALATPAGGLRPIEGAGRSGAVRVARPYGHLRAMRPILPEIVPGATPEPEWAKVWADAIAGMAPRGSAWASAEATTLPAERLIPQVVSAVEVETDAGVFRVERRAELLTHSDLAWAIANLEAGEPDGVVPLPRRQLAMLLTLLPPPEDPDHPEGDPTWGWAHRLRGPWERGALHAAGKLGRLIAVDPDMSGRGMHRACFEMLGTEEVVWAAGVPCFRAGSVYELVPLTRRGSASRWLTWPLSKARRRAGMPERPKWEIARAVHRVGAPRWPLAGVV
ncbi:MAG TPA: hypothetical protein VGR57_02785, partial [Ktedonobacterales bacterium]|nr:hypothetical protein [Ktedonobacterales bacterium]